MATQDIKALLLVGGKGTRLRSVVPSAPKPLAPVGDRPFLEILVEQLRAQGLTRLIMGTGYMADEIEASFGDGKLRGLEIEYSRESQPLGTGGAVKLAQPLLEGSPDFIVMNGDSFVEVDFSQLIAFHRQSSRMATLSVVHRSEASRFGTVRVDASGRVIAFEEKVTDAAHGLINAGVYVFSRGIFEHIPEGMVSLEKDVFPRLLSDGIYALEQRGDFIDIGTPEDYARAQSIYARLQQAASGGMHRQ